MQETTTFFSYNVAADVNIVYSTITVLPVIFYFLSLYWTSQMPAEILEK